MKRQQKQKSVCVTAVLALGLCLGAPAATAEVYGWRTEDGGYAFTDDREHVPARYADQAKALGLVVLMEAALPSDCSSVRVTELGWAAATAGGTRRPPSASPPQSLGRGRGRGCVWALAPRQSCRGGRRL